MLNHRTATIIKREIREQIFTKKFVIMTLSFPLIMVLMIGLQILFVTFDREGQSRLLILNESEALQSLVRAQFADSDFADNERFTLQYDLVNDESGADSVVNEHREQLLSGALTGIIFIPDSARDDKVIHYYSTNPTNQNIQSPLREQVNRAVVGDYFNALNLDNNAVAYARSNVNINGIRVTEQGNAGTGPGNLIIAGVLTFLIYISLLMMGPMVMGAVNEEKTSRVVEILLSSVTPNELMLGKVLGTSITGLLQMAIWTLPLALVGLNALPVVASILADLDFQFSMFHLLYFLLNYLFGLMIFLSIFAAFGAMFDNPQDAQQSLTPVMFLIIIPFLLAFTLARNPANTLAEVSSMLPFANLLIMPARMTLIDVPAWQILLTIAVNVLTFYLCIRGGAKLYRIAILLTGKRPTLKEMYKWLRYQ